MSQIKIDGFISDESLNGRDYFHQKYKDVFDYAKEINKFNMDLMQNEEIDWKDKHKLITKILYLRIIEHFQGTILMLERGMISQAKVLTRAMLETTFIHIALQKKPNLLQCYFDQHEDGTKRNLKAFLKFQNEKLRASAKKENFEKHYVDKYKTLKGNELNPLSPKQWAIEAGLEDFYNLYYGVFSNSTHSNLLALEDNIDNSEAEINLAFGPSENNLYDVFQCCVYILINAMNSAALIHGQDRSKILDSLLEKIRQLDEKYL